MGSPIKICFVMLALVAQLFFFGYIAAEPLEAGDNLSGQEIGLPATASEQRTLTLVSFSQLVVEGEIVGAVAVYHDPATKRPIDYWELYNSEGGLSAVGWLDRFGIQQMAVDRGLVEGTYKLEGVFVVLIDGDAV
jgi:hypothetical protein